MHIVVKANEGLSGKEEALADTETARLAADVARQIEEMVERMGFFSLPPGIGQPGGFDLPNYEVTITDKGRNHTVTFDKTDFSPETALLRRLIETVLSSA